MLFNDWNWNNTHTVYHSVRWLRICSKAAAYVQPYFWRQIMTSTWLARIPFFHMKWCLQFCSFLPTTLVCTDTITLLINVWELVLIQHLRDLMHWIYLLTIIVHKRSWKWNWRLIHQIHNLRLLNTCTRPITVFVFYEPRMCLN